ncbi:MAG: class I SAM-dependent methyltransferase, partial [Actinomycetota bacterium]|nr:class I SAM-dependent methyltransferase [Actinomycetota bacterium]
KDIQPLRERACAGLQGTVLELGFGSGLNCSLYPESVTSVLAIEPADRAWDMAAERRTESTAPVSRAGLDGQRLDLADDSVDSVLITFTLCTIPDVDTALQEVARVLRPGGTVHIAEHGTSPDPSVARWQRRLDPAQQVVFGGCHLTRNPILLLESAGFDQLDVQTGYINELGPMRPWMYGYSGSARLSAA